MTVTASWISKKPDRCGGEACVRESRLPVWLLVDWRRLGRSDEWLLANYPALSAADLAVAWEYADKHPDEIGEAIRRNAEA